ncbi:MAG TPA: hypothetical protein PLE50_08970 [Rhabdaerophilum sp.]|nr:hypothetical protein [Rhabdaerophilum sp.]
MAALAQATTVPALEQAGIIRALPPLAERLDTRAFAILASREEAEAMFIEDRLREGADPEWTAYFVECLVEFLIWQNAPAGRLSQSDLDWLVGLIGDAPSPSVPALLFALVRELNEAPERLVALAMRFSRNRFVRAH